MGFVKKKPPKELGLHLRQSTRGLHGPASEHLASSNSPSIWAEPLITCVLPRQISARMSSPYSTCLFLSLGHLVAWNLSTMIYSRRTVNLFVQLVFLVRLGATQFPAFYHLQMKNCLFLALKGFGPGSLLCYLGQVLTSPSVSSSLPSQDYNIIDNQMWQGIWRCLGIDKALYICRLSKAWWRQLLLSKKPNSAALERERLAYHTAC